MSRVFVAPGELDAAVAFYEGLVGQSRDMELVARDQGMHLVSVGPFLLLDLDDDVLGPAATNARATTVTMVFAQLDAAVRDAVAGGASLVDEPTPVPTGRRARLRHPDGLLVEYLEHRPGPDDVGETGA